MEEVTVFAPATVANVSCGFDVLGFCLDRVGDEITVRKSEIPGVRITRIEGQDLPKATNKNVAGVAVEALLQQVETSFGFEIEIKKGIKAGSGIGSSAASSAGAVYGVNALLGNPFTKNELIPFAMKGEELASGAAHTNNVSPALLGALPLRCGKKPDVISLPAPKELFTTIIHPKIELRTADARSVLKKHSLGQSHSAMGKFAGLVSGLFTNDYDLIARSLVDVVIEPERSVLIPILTN